MTVSQATPRSAYIHVPFCARRCGYCNFTLVAGREELIDAYLDAIEIELRGLGIPREVDTLFFGGGTPTHLASSQLQRLFEIVATWHPLTAGGELSVEANPTDVDAATVELLVNRGVTRISLGGQSFQPEKLRQLERDHQPDDVTGALRLVRGRFSSVSLDLIFGCPGETIDLWAADLEAAIAESPDHLSTYGLTIERGTTFWGRAQRGELTRVDEALDVAMYQGTIGRLARAGYEHYEVSNFARAGHRCRHHDVYWGGRPYFAAGPGASRYVNGRRETNHRSTTTWLKRVLAGDSPVAEIDELAPPDRAREALVFGLRRLEGVERTTFARDHGYGVDALAGDVLQRYVARGMLADDGQRVRLTPAGLLVSDSIWPDFLAP